MTTHICASVYFMIFYYTVTSSLYWQHDIEEVGISKLEEQAAQLEKDLFVKERETLDVLKELEATKTIVEELKLKLQKEASEFSVTLETDMDDKNMIRLVKNGDESNHENPNSVEGLSPCPSSAPGLILIELKQAKLNLTRTTNDLADIRASVESFNKKLEKERISLEKTRERLTQNSSKISSLEEELNQTRLKLRLAKNSEIKVGSDDALDISKELQRLCYEAEQFKKVGEAAKSEVLRAMSEIEQTKAKIKTAEIRLVAARKMKEAARATEAVALAEIKALSNHTTSSGEYLQNPGGVTLSSEEYSSLIRKAQEAEELSKSRVIDAMLQVDEANVSKMEILKRVEEATKEVKTSKKALEEALNRVEAANMEKLAVEDTLRKWRSEHGQKRRSVHNSTKFKNSCPSHHRRESHLVDVNGLNLVNDRSTPVLKPTLSIGQILSRKLLMPEEFESGMLAERSSGKRKVSLGQMLSKQYGDLPSSPKAERESSHKQFPAKRKKFGFARFSLLMTKQSKKKNKPTLNLR
jgi:peptidoglycan hydrolase CwlO-like protein